MFYIHIKLNTLKKIKQKMHVSMEFFVYNMTVLVISFLEDLHSPVRRL